MYRNPVERLFSGYRSKVMRFPLHGLKRSSRFNWLRMEIYKYKHPKLYAEWYAKGGTRPVNISFTDFVDYYLNKKTLNTDEHFQTIYDLCQPCHVRYSYYGNFKTFDTDVEALMEHIRSDSSLLRQGYYQGEGETTDLAPQYYSLLPNEQKIRIINKLALDLNFYYTLFPSERDSHKVIMGIDYDVPLSSS